MYRCPSHINIKDGQISLINNDHTILGLRASAYLMPYLPEKYRLLPLLQSVWYIPAGLDIWNQLLRQISRPLCDDEGHQRAAAGLRPGRVAGGSRADPRSRHGRGTAAFAHDRDRQRRFAARSYGLFLGLAEDEPARAGAARTARISRPDRPAGHRDRPQGAQHRPQGDPGARRSPTSPMSSAGIRRTASTIWASPTWRSGRFIIRSTIQSACGRRRVSRGCRQGPRCTPTRRRCRRPKSRKWSSS